MRLDEFESVGGESSSVSYEDALRKAVKIAALCEITNCGNFDDNTAHAMLSISHPGHSYNEIKSDWKKAYVVSVKKEKFKMNLKIGKIE